MSSSRSRHPRPRTPSESARAVRVMPGASIGTRNAVTPSLRKPGRVDANTITTDPGSAPGIGDHDAKQPSRRRRAHHVGGKLARLVDGGGPRGDDLARELLDRLLEALLFGSEF